MRPPFVRRTGGALLLLGLGAALVLPGSWAGAAEATVGLGTAGSYALLAGSTITNTGPSVISGDVGLSPGTAIVGFPPATVTNGTIHAADAAAAQAESDLTVAYDDAAGRSSTATVLDLGGQLLVPGVYTATTSLALTGTVTLDGQGDPAAVFIFKAGTTLTTASASAVALINGASPCNVFWQIGSSATLGTDSVFAGTVLALESISATTRAAVQGRLLARNGAVTLDTNTITAPLCAASSTTTTTTAVPTTEARAADTAGTGDTAVPAAVPATTTGAPGPAAPAGGSGSATTRTPSAGGTTTGTARTANPPLARTGFEPWLAALAAVLILIGTALTWTSRPPLLHAVRRW